MGPPLSWSGPVKAKVVECQKWSEPSVSDRAGSGEVALHGKRASRRREINDNQASMGWPGAQREPLSRNNYDSDIRRLDRRRSGPPVLPFMLVMLFCELQLTVTVVVPRAHSRTSERGELFEARSVDSLSLQDRRSSADTESGEACSERLRIATESESTRDRAERPARERRGASDGQQGDELADLLADLYAHQQELQERLDHYVRLLSHSDRSAKSASKEIKMKLGADEESLLNWLRQRQASFRSLENATFKLLDEYPNRSINVCLDGPKILVLPNVSDVVYCYTREQWIEKLWSDLRLSAFHYPIIALNMLIFLFGTTGNIFVCLSVYRNQQLRSVTNYFIVNLAFADFLVILICLPATVVWDLSLTWFFGTVPCKLIMFLQDVSISVSVLTLTAISIDRYQAICHPLRFKSNLRQAKGAIVLIWLLSLLIMAPDLIYLGALESEELREAGLDTVLYSDCNYTWSERASRIFQFVKTILLYLLPILLMFGAHFRIMRALRVACPIDHECPAGECSPERVPSATQLAPSRPQQSADQPGQLMVTMHNKDKLESRKKAAKMLMAIVLLFGVCYLPVHVINFLRQYMADIPQTDITSTICMLAHCICYLNSAINPIIYNHMNSVFRAEFKKFLSCLHWLGRRRRPLERHNKWPPPPEPGSSSTRPQEGALRLQQWRC